MLSSAVSNAKVASDPGFDSSILGLVTSGPDPSDGTPHPYARSRDEVP